jgi:hypothetical protein
VRVDKVHIDLVNGTAGLAGMSIANPAGYALPNAFSLGEIRAGIDLESLQEEPYIINEITVLAPRVFVEINEDAKTNLNELKNNLTSATASGKKTGTPAAEQGSTPGPRLIIRRVKFADGDIQARVAALDDKEYSLKLPGLEMSDLGGTTGATTGELAKEILQRLTDRASEEVKNRIIDKELAKLKADIQQKVDAEEARLKAKADAEKEKQLEKVEDKLKGLFNR